MADVLKRLVGPTQLTTSSVTLYTVPAGVTTVLRNIHVTSTVNITQSFTISLNGATSNMSSALFFTFPVTAFAVADWSGILVLNPNDYLAASASVMSALTIAISGVEAS